MLCLRLITILLISAHYSAAKASGFPSSFTIDNANINAHDNDEDGYYDYIKARVEIIPHCTGAYNLIVRLTDKDKKFITARPYFEYASPINHPSQSFFVKQTNQKHTITIQFSGEEIRRSNTDGPYTISIRHFGSLDNLQCPSRDTNKIKVLDIQTPAYKANGFAERCGTPPDRFCHEIYP